MQGGERSRSDSPAGGRESLDRPDGRLEQSGTHTLQARFDVFLSHNSRDKDAVERIATSLKESGITPWFDKWNIAPGARWQRAIADGMDASSSCAVFIGEADLGDWTQQELDIAFDRAAKHPRFRVFPVLLPGIPEPFDATRLPRFLSTRNWVDLRGGIRDPKGIQQMINAIRGIPLTGAPEVEARPGVCPYRGLQTFDEEHAEFFFGRDADIQRLLERLKESRFLAVLGPSGSGKSSLVRAGLVPALKRGALPGSDTWEVVVFRPGAAPLTVLSSLLATLFPQGAIQDTLDRLGSDERTLHLAVSQGLATEPEGRRVLWVIDQFEEVFTLSRSDPERTQFFNNLLHAALSPGGRNVVVITMRADFFPRCAAHADLAQAMSANQHLAWPMSMEALAQVIEEPARVVGLALEEGLTETILRDVGDQPGALPLLEHALLELWERRRGTMLTLEAYREAGGVTGSLAKRADLVYEGLPEAERAIVRRVLLRLTQPGEGTEDTRRRAAFDELVGAREEREPVERVVSVLTGARLLTTGTDPIGHERMVDVAHEALIRGWPRLRGWLEEDRAGLRTHRRLTEAAQEWERLDRDPDALYRGARLAEASEWAEPNLGALNELEEEFLRESAEAAERARRSRVRRLRVAAGALGAGLVVVAALAVVAFLQKGRADEQGRVARSRELAATSLEQLERDPQLSLILAIEAYETAPTAQAEAAVRGALVNSPLRRILSVGAPVVSVVSPDGDLFATWTPFGEVALWDRASGRRLAVLEAGVEPEGPEALPGFDPGPLKAISFSPDGRLLFAGLEGKDGRIWSVPDSRLVARLDGASSAEGWTPDGRFLLTARTPEDRFDEGPPEGPPGDAEPPPESPPGPEGPPEGPPGGPEAPGGLRLWDVTNGTVQAEFRGPFGPFTAGVLSPDGRLVAIPRDGAVRVVSGSTGRTVGVFEGELFPFAPFSADGNLLVVGGLEEDFSSARVFDVASGRLVRVLRPGSGVYDAAASPDGSRVATGHIVGARIWEVESDRFVDLVGHAGAVVRVSFSLDGTRVVTISEDNTARVWDAETGRPLAVLAGHGGGILSASATRDGRSVVTSSGTEVRVWDVGGEAAAVLRGHEAPVTSARFSPDGRSIISADVGGGTARVWDVATEEQTSVLRPPPVPAVLSAEFGADGRLALTSGFRLGPGLEGEPLEQMPTILWDVGRETVRGEFSPPQDDPLELCGPIEGCTFHDGALSPDGTRVATVGADGLLHVWDAVEGTALETVELSGNRAPPDFPGAGWGIGVEWTPDGTKVAALTGDGVVHVFDATTFRRIREFGAEAEGGPLSVLNPELSADGSRVAVGYPDGTARVWETDTGRLVAELPHAGPVYDVGFSRDGSFLVTASGDAPTIWDLASQRPLTQLFGHQAAVITVDFSPDGVSIVSAGEDETVRIWRCEVCVPIDRLLDLARERALRDLTSAERARFLHQG